MVGYYPSGTVTNDETNDELTWTYLSSVVIDKIDKIDKTVISLDIPSATYTDERVGFQYFKFDAAFSDSSGQSSVSKLIFPEITLNGQEYKNTIWKPGLLTMTVTTTIPLNNQATMFGIRDLSTTNKSKVITWKKETADEFHPISSDPTGISGYCVDRTKLVSELLSQTDGEINKSLIIASQNISTLYTTKLSGTTNQTDYLKMRVDVGSIFTEYPIISNVDDANNITDTDDTINLDNLDEISFNTTYSFKNWADFVLFYYYYKHTINHYLCKLSLLFKSFKFYANQTNQLNNNGTLSDVLDNPSAYFTNKNVAEILTLNSLISNDCFWRGFINDNTIDDKYYDMTLSSNMSISPVGNMNWTSDAYQSDLISTNIVDYTPTSDILSTFIDNTLSANISPSADIDYNNNLKKLYSFYRPYYMTYKNMFITKTNSSTYDNNGFCYGCLKKSDTTASTTYYTLNRDAINQDYGWIDENGNFNIDNILRAADKINYNGLKEDSK